MERLCRMVSSLATTLSNLFKGKEKPMSHLSQPSTWEAPDIGVHKLNFDAAFKNGKGVVAWVERNKQGKVLDAGGKTMTVPSTITAEASAALECLTVAKQKELSSVLIEGDSNLVIVALQGKHEPSWEYENIIWDARQVASSMKNVTFSWCRRSANTMAHKIASWLARDDYRTEITLGDIPLYMLEDSGCT